MKAGKHSEMIKKALIDFDNDEKRQIAILTDNEIQSLFVEEKNEQAMQLIEKKYGKKQFQYGEARHLLLKAIFSFNKEMENIDDFNSVDWDLTDKAISLARKFLKMPKTYKTARELNI